MQRNPLVTSALLAYLTAWTLCYRTDENDKQPRQVVLFEGFSNGGFGSSGDLLEPENSPPRMLSHQKCFNNTYHGQTRIRPAVGLEHFDHKFDGLNPIRADIPAKLVTTSTSYHPQPQAPQLVPLSSNTNTPSRSRMATPTTNHRKYSSQTSAESEVTNSP